MCTPNIYKKLYIPALEKAIAKTKKAMQEAAKKLEFLEAAQIRDEMLRLEDLMKEKFDGK
ncbi:MAG: UvrB/UvrC motif-containing protein [Paludibacteraceae bacterium]